MLTLENIRTDTGSFAFHSDAATKGAPAPLFLSAGDRGLKQHAAQEAGHYPFAPVMTHLPGPRVRNQCGFTLTELIAVMVIAGILAAVAVPRFFERSIFDSRGFRDQVISALRYAQKSAIAQRRFVCVTFAANSVTLTYGATAACGSNLAGPAGQLPYSVTSPTADVTLSGGTSFSFNPLGSASAAQSITVSGITTPITVVADTGYVQ